MADAELAKALKDLPNRVQTASKNERREILQNVVNVLSNPGKEDDDQDFALITVYPPSLTYYRNP